MASDLLIGGALVAIALAARLMIAYYMLARGTEL